MSCSDELMTQLIESITCTKPSYCPPCVSTLELVVDSNTARIAAIESWQATQFLTGSAVIDFVSIASLGTDEETITVTGASVGDPVMISVPSGIDAGIIWSAYVSAADVVTIRAYNSTVGAIDIASGTYKAMVFPVS